ncbi:MAG: preprotein translocase subunit SecG [Candidatus Spechtbacteria bacterium]|nr:preprotein translocase subunit SecG [Candidatus Spechtbacteria bacterium]
MIVSIIQIITAILLIVCVLLQQRGSGLSSAFGGTGGVYYQKRGFEKILFRATIGLSALFLAIALLNLLK